MISNLEINTFSFRVAAENAIDKFRENVSELDEKLKNNKTGYLVGGQLSIADVSAAMIVDFIETVPGVVDYDENIERRKFSFCYIFRVKCFFDYQDF